MTYRIRRSVESETVVFALSGEVDLGHADRLRELLATETYDRTILDLEDVTLVHRMAVQFLGRIEDRGVRFVNCPGYVRSWIDAERALRVPGEGGGQP